MHLCVAENTNNFSYHGRKMREKKKENIIVKGHRHFTAAAVALKKVLQL